ncbi:MAG TPA: divalent-cation tolerance protein CutA [Blastocatellia bacterium]|nr:divalent-cation tolerance protein CutA [Blastocatellia bacterium]
MSDELIIFVTAPNEDEALRIADALVEEQLAACVNIISGVESIYHWQGRVERDRELLMIIKSSAGRYADLERRVKELHSYTTPEIIGFRIERGSQSYLDWIRDSTPQKTG